MPTYTNRVYDIDEPGFIRWDTATPDKTGVSYPGPDAFGDTFDYCVESITATASSGEINTASSPGTGIDLTLPKVGVDLQFKKLASVGAASNVLTLATSGGGEEAELTLAHQLAEILGSGGSTAYGVLAGNVGTGSGAGITALGASAGASLLAGADNTLIGTSAAILLTTGDDNIVLGSTSLSLATTGSDNIVVGSNSLTDIVAGDGNIFIGNSIDAGSDASNLVNIGDLIFGDRSGTTSNKFRVGGTGSAAAQVELVLLTSASTDKVAVLAEETTGLNGAKTQHFVGDRDPIVGAVSGNPGDTYTRVDGVNSDIYVHQGAGTDTISWKVTVGGGAGEINTASNIGTGIDVYKVKVSLDLELKRLQSLDTAVLVIANAGNEVTFDFPNMLMETSAGDCNTFFGEAAGNLSVETGTNNTGFGAGALEALTTAVDNTAVGCHALQLVTDGGNNTVIGKDVGAALVSGDNNILIGDSTGATLATGSFNILIGDGVDTTAASANHLNIGDVIFGSVGTGAHDDVRIGGSGTVSESVQFQVESPVGRTDKVALMRWENTDPTNGAKSYTFLGDRDPIAGVVSGAPGDRYYRVSGVTSDLYLHIGVGSDATSWKSFSGDVNGPGTAVDNTVLVFDSTTGKLVKEATGFTHSAGKVGVGPSTIDETFHVEGAGAQKIKISSTDNSAGLMLRAEESTDDHEWTILANAAGELDISTGGVAVISLDSAKLGFFNVAPVVRPAAYTPTNVTPDRAYDADTVTVAELADIVGTLIADLQGLGLVQ